MSQSRIEKKSSTYHYRFIAISNCSSNLFTIKLKDFGIDIEPLSFLPPYATTNGITALF
jgi:putative membrane protein